MGMEVAKRVTIWTEGGSYIGMGHIARSVNLSRALKDKGIDSMYYVNNDLTTMEILKKNDLPYRISPMEDVQGIFDEDEVVIIDTKKDVPGQVEFLKCRRRKVVLIDNNTAAAELADLTVMPSIYFDGKKDYMGPGFIGGSEYLIIGDSFIAKREESLALEFSLPLQVLVSMGGADPNHITEKVVAALLGMDNVEVDVVIGNASQPAESIFELEKEGDGKLRFHKSLTDLAPLMIGAHVAFTALGTTINELVFMGVPPIVISNYFDDSQDLDRLSKLEVGIAMGHHSDCEGDAIRAAVESFVGDRSGWESMRAAAAALTDGLGVGRIASLIAELGWPTA
ncbi:hypothetical protein MNBD_DELTA01-356 [hydrothermal vent metagenome]|uniref:UDP-2,4-diacetamido-2,4, 6-trideoxy-beta-L-altropyranose hydrolase n=1 Tax=hydrothermal vent metagenome TaxID=652676 RepID=A0A3B0RM15_9ZZZZ